MAAPDLNATAKLIAVALAQGFANNETAECRPGLAALMKAIAAPKRTVMQALSDLKQAGWIVAAGGNAPGRAAAYAFRWPGRGHEQVPNPAPEQVPNPAPEQVQKSASTGAENCNPPCTPYKDKPHMNHRAHPHPRAAIRGLPMPQCLTTIIEPDSLAAERWDAWLQAEGFPPLDRIAHRSEGGWRMPVTVAPTKGEEIPYRIALRWAEWLRSKA
jgi:hypothetical protein